MPMPRIALTDDFAFQNFQRRKKGGRAMSDIVVGVSTAAPPFERQARLGAIQRLDLTLFIEAQDQTLVGRIQIEAHDVGKLFQKFQVPRELERASQMRL